MKGIGADFTSEALSISQSDIRETRVLAVSIEPERQALLDGVQERFGVKLLLHEELKLSCYRDDVTVHTFFDPEQRLTEQLKLDIRRWVENQGWQYSRQILNWPSSEQLIEHVYIARMILVAIGKGYHATRRASWPSIRCKGLFPSTSDRRTTERYDCEGNIYVCEHLGTPGDEGIQGSKSAHWWRGQLARKNRFNDPDWVILEVNLDQLGGARIQRDIWSESGIIVNNVAVISPERILAVFSENLAAK